MQLPNDLASKIVGDALPWPQAAQFHIDAFLQKYTLHDSYWIGLHVNCGADDSAIAVIRFDPVWNPSVSQPTSLVAGWPLLFIRFTCVSAIQLSQFSDIGGIQRGISSVTVRPISDKEVITTLHDHYGAAVTLQHFALVDVLTTSPEGDVIPLSNVA